ncbi:MAG TPA: hypothetical protein VJ972_04760 [Anaerolineales bacterium]|nr:hypothetical protein [Anaerolineales bacterium]
MSNKRGISPEIVAALIGVAGTVGVAYFFSQPASSPEPGAPIVVTATSAPDEAGSPTVSDVPPASTETQGVPIGQDWNVGCISSSWQAYPATVITVDNGNGCLQEPVHVFNADAGKLSFLGERNEAGPVEDYGMFAALPESGTVTVTVSLDDLNNADLWVGVFSEADLRSDGLLLVVPAGNVRKRSIEQKNVFTYETVASTQTIDQNNGFSFTFTFTNTSVIGEINPFVFKTNPMAMPVGNKWIYIGYRGFSGSYNIQGSFANFFLE